MDPVRVRSPPSSRGIRWTRTRTDPNRPNRTRCRDQKAKEGRRREGKHAAEKDTNRIENEGRGAWNANEKKSEESQGRRRREGTKEGRNDPQRMETGRPNTAGKRREGRTSPQNRSL
eukprot:scaffold325_cov343-Pavlova_lutheri.AAC.6